jgi:hypothetical protein
MLTISSKRPNIAGTSSPMTIEFLRESGGSGGVATFAHGSHAHRFLCDVRSRSEMMRFAMPNYPCEFELPDGWWVEAGMVGFARTALAYRSTGAAVPVPLQEIEPPYRRPEKDWRGFDRRRLISVLNGIATGAEIAPVPLLQLPPDLPSRAPYGFRVLDGFHRFYGSIAAGFECLPASIVGSGAQ